MQINIANSTVVPSEVPIIQGDIQKSLFLSNHRDKKPNDNQFTITEKRSLAHLRS